MGFWTDLWLRVSGSNGSAPISHAVEGFIGRRLKELEGRHDFFRFFHFEPMGKERPSPYERADSGPVMLFRPSGEAFQDLVMLHTWVSPRGLIQTIRLTVRWSFIDDAATCVFAADLYNSFLRSVGEVREGDAIDAFAREISGRSMGRSSRPVLMRGSAPQALGEMSAAYRIYEGRERSGNLVYGSGKLKLVARNVAEGEEFEILVWAVEMDG